MRSRCSFCSGRKRKDKKKIRRSLKRRDKKKETSLKSRLSNNSHIRSSRSG